MHDLTEQTCQAKPAPVVTADLKTLMEHIPGWEYVEDSSSIVRTFTFSRYCETIAFVNSVAWLSECENHHPDMHVTYKQCLVRYTTHSVGGVSINDFICAAKINRLL